SPFQDGLTLCGESEIIAPRRIPRSACTKESMNMESPDTDPGVPATAHKQALQPLNPASSRWLQALQDMSPAYFGLVMATGIVCLASDMMGHDRLARVLLVLNTVQYGLPWVAYLLRAWRFPLRFFHDMIDYAKGPGYFTLV